MSALWRIVLGMLLGLAFITAVQGQAKREVVLVLLILLWVALRDTYVRRPPH